jgi:hypothetical protein
LSSRSDGLRRVKPVDGSGLSDTLAAFLCPASGAQAALQPATTVVIIRFAIVLVA